MTTNYQCITNIDALKNYIKDSKVLAFDFETAPDDMYRRENKAAVDSNKAHIVGCSFSNADYTGVYVPLKHRLGTNMDFEIFINYFKELMEDTNIIKVVHNLPFEAAFCYKHNIIVQEPVYDTLQAMQMTIREDFKFRTMQECGLKRLALEIFNEKIPTFEDVTDGRYFDELDPQDYETIRYGCADSDFAFRLRKKANEWFDKFLPKHRWIVENIESPTAVYVGMMKHNGIPVDKEKMLHEQDIANNKIKEIKEKIAFIIGDIKIGDNASTDAFKKYLFDTLQLPVIKEGKNKKPALDDEVVQRLKDWSIENKPEITELFTLIQEYRKWQKLNKTYVEGQIKFINSKTNNLHPNLMQLATKTGRFACDNPNCFDKDTEILTKRGWVLIKDIDYSDFVAQWQDGQIDFIHPTSIIKYPYNNKLIHLHNVHIDLMVTPNHRCLLQDRKTRKYKVINAKLYPSDNWQLHASNYKFGIKTLDKNFIKLLVATQADGYYSFKRLDFAFYKERKVQRFQEIINALNLKYTRKLKKDGKTRFIIYPCEIVTKIKELLGKDKTFGWWLLDYDKETIETMLNELYYWDGCFTRKTTYSSSKKINCDVIQALYTLTNKRAKIREYHNKCKNAQTNYQVDNTDKRNYSLTTNIEIEHKEYNDFVYCVSVPSSYIVVRRNGKTAITGNCQNWPRKGQDPMKIRDFIVAPVGYSILESDYSQAELRIAAYLSNDETLLQCYKDGIDVHATTTSHLFNMTIEEAKDEKDPQYKTRRAIAKATIFGTFYGISGEGLSTNLYTEAGLHYTKEQCNEFIKSLLEKYSGYDKWQRETRRFARYKSYIETAYGRRRYLIEIQSKDYGLKMSAEREAINTPVQGLCADLIKLSMGRLIKELKDKPYIKPILTVHDSLGFIVKDDHIEEAKEIVKRCMETMPPLLTNFQGLVADISIGKTYGSL